MVMGKESEWHFSEEGLFLQCRESSGSPDFSMIEESKTAVKGRVYCVGFDSETRKWGAFYFEEGKWKHP